MMPKDATARPLWALATAAIGAMKPKDEQVARQHVLVDQQEQRGRHGREEQGGGWVETGQNRHQERGAEHGDDVLRADFRGARPGQPLVRFDDLAGLQRFAVAVELPREQARDWIGHAIVS